MSEMKHTPTPWRVEGATVIWSPSAGSVVAQASALQETSDVRFTAPSLSSPHFDEIAANAAFIVQSCNAHDALMDLFAASEKYFEIYDDSNSHAALTRAWIDFRAAGRNAHAALAKAKGE
jgi:hypothetical protein